MHTKRPIWVGATAAALGMLLIAVAASADTATLQLKRIQGDPNMWTPQTMVYRSTSSQSFFAYLDMPSYNYDRPDLKVFKENVKKEPKYVSKSPFKGAAKLGGKQFLFAFDESKEGDKKYNRLYFDANGNGDLTDEKVIEPAKPKTGSGVMYPSGYSQFTFGPVEIQLDVNGTKVDYAFRFSCMSHAATTTSVDAKGKQETRQMTYLNASLTPAVYREGEITLDGKKRKIVLLDNNCNGTFDDATTVMNANTSPTETRAYPQFGDVLLIDPEMNSRDFSYDLTASNSRQMVAKLLSFEGKIYDMTVSAAGDKVTIEPSQVPVGFVTNPNEGFRALIYGDRGVLRVAGGKDKKTVVPEGEWKLAQYTIDKTGWQPPKEPAGAAKPAKSASLLDSLTKAVAGTAAAPTRTMGPTRVSAAAGGATKSVTVRKDETVEMLFGPPLKPVVRAYSYGQPGGTDRTVQLELAIAGSSGEQCTDLMINGARPAKPEFTITNPKGEVVQKGSFEYG